MLPLIVLAGILAKYELVKLPVVRPMVPVDVIVPPDNGAWAVMDVIPVIGYVVCVY